MLIYKFIMCQCPVEITSFQKTIKIKASEDDGYAEYIIIYLCYWVLVLMG